MFDSAKIEIQDPELMERFRRNTGLPVLTKVDRATGEIPRGTDTARLLNLRLTHYPTTGRNVIQGSLHRYANDGAHNADQFTHGRFCRTVKALADLLDFDPATAKIRALEVGVNLNLPADLLTRMIAYKGRLPGMDTFRGRGHERRWEFENYTLKGYDKGRQYGLPDPVVRWEVSTNRMRYLTDNGLPVATLADLTDPRRVEGFGPLLAGLFAELTFADLADLDRLTGAERKVYERGATFQFWETLKDPERRRYARQRFDALRAKYGANEREQIAELIEQRFQDLLTGRASPRRAENSHVFTDSEEPEIPTFSPFKYRVNLWELPPPVEAPADLPPRRACKTCGADISHRRLRAVFCPQKRCRNVDSNPRNNFKRRYARALDACQLFDPSAVVRLTPEQTRLMAY